MKCPYCAHSVRFEEDTQWTGLLHDDPKQGYSVGHGTCPECGELVVRLRRGPFQINSHGDFLTETLSEVIIHPRTRARDPLPPEVSGEYRKEFEEAYLVLDASPKASAAISRRLLQHTLREQFKIGGSSLAKQIDEFIAQAGIPSHLTEAVDAVRNIGNLASHPLKDTQTGVVVDVEPGEAEWLLETLEALFDFCFVQPSRLAQRRKLLNAKLAAIGKPPLKS